MRAACQRNGFAPLALVLMLLTLAASSDVTAQRYTSAAQVVIRFAGRAQPPVAFEVASVKQNLTWTQPGSGLAAPQPGGRYRAVGVTVQRLIGDAYGMPDARVTGGPDWIRSLRFDVDARAAGAPAPAEIMRMLRPLLAERFNVALHLEAREMAVYALTSLRGDRTGPQLRSSDGPCAEAAANYFPSAGPNAAGPPCGDFRMGAGSLVARGMAMPQLAERLAALAGRPVLDRTGHGGFYDLVLTWSPETPGDLGPRALGDEPPADTAAPAIFTAVRDQLGLDLQPQRAPVDVLVIDRVDRPTAD